MLQVALMILKNFQVFLFSSLLFLSIFFHSIKGFNCLDCSLFARNNPGAQRCQIESCCHYKKAHIGKLSGKHLCPILKAHSLEECPSGNKKGHVGEERKKRKYNL